MLILVPTELGVLLWARPRRGRGSARHPLSPQHAAARVGGAGAASSSLAFLGFGRPGVRAGAHRRVFGWLPDWFVAPIPVDRIGDYSPGWIVTLAAYLAINGFLGPIVEELYFRGYLLPRMERMGRWAPLVNVTLFSLYHFWSPWQILARILGLGPTVYAVRWKQNVYLGMAVHCALNTLGVLLISSLILGRL